MKILLSCGNNIGQPTGYGGQALILARYFRRAGHEVVCIAWSMVHPDKNLRNKMIPFMQVAKNASLGRVSYLTKEDERLFSKHTWSMVNPLGQWPVTIPKQTVNDIVCMTQADVFIAFQDIFVFADGPVIVPTFVWMPFHFRPMEQRVVRSLGCFDVHVAMTRYGEMLCHDYFGPCCPAAKSSAGQSVKEIEYAPHAREGDIFHAIEGIFSEDDAERQEALGRRADMRSEFSWPRDAFVCLIVASNSESSNRKAFDAQLQAWSRFASNLETTTGRKAWLHIHSALDGAMDMLRILEMLGELSDRTVFTDLKDTCGKSKVTNENDTNRVGERVSCSKKSSLHKTSPQKMARMYQCADLLLAATCAEGFGVPIIEAQLCGCPVVTNKTTAMTELTRVGLSVRPAQWIARNDFNSGWDVPSAVGLCRAMTKIAHWSPSERARRIRKVYGEVHAEFTPDPVGRKWVEVIENVHARRNADGTVRGFPECRNRQLAAGLQVRKMFAREVELGRSISPWLQQLAICKELERDANVMSLIV